MKKTVIIFFLSNLIWACNDSWVHPWPDTIAEKEEPKPQIEHPTIAFPISETKTPYFELKDAGFEALLIILSIDSDNQINGKVAEKDLASINDLSHTSPIYPLHPIVKEQKRDFLLRKYGEIPTIESFDDVKHLQSLKNLELWGGNSMNLTENQQLERISIRSASFQTIDLSNLAKLKEVEFKWPPMPSSFTLPGDVKLDNNPALEVFKYTGQAKSLNLNTSPNLKILHFSSSAYGADTLDISHNKLLEEVNVFTGNKPTTVFISAESKRKIDQDSTQWLKGNLMKWKVKH